MSSIDQRLINCSIGETLNNECHKDSYTKASRLVNVSDLSKTDKKLLCLRSGVSDERLSTICEHHKIYYLKKYETYQTFCCDPFTSHKTNLKVSLRRISLDYSESLKDVENIKHPKPGQKVCSACRLKLRTKFLALIPKQHGREEGTPESMEVSQSEHIQIEQPDEEGFESEQEPIASSSQMEFGSDIDVTMDSEDSQDSVRTFQTTGYTSESSPDIRSAYMKEKRCSTLENLNISLYSLGESPIRLHSLPDHMRVPYAKKKIQSVVDNIEEKVSIVMQKDILDEICRQEKEELKENEAKAKDMDNFIALLKSKFETDLTRREKVQLLTLIPSSWSRKKIQEEFQVTEPMVRESRTLLKEGGILASPGPKKGRKLRDNVIEQVINFFESDEYSRALSGMKDKVSIAKNKYKSKRLLLGNLNELYASFKFDYAETKISFSKFCKLRPKWCVLAGASGTHNVCVCEIHQNVELLLDAAPINETYKDLMKLLVCSMEKKECMLRRCSNCPDSEILRSFLIEKFEDWCLDDEIEYSSWTSVDRTQQLIHRTTLDEYLNTLVASIEKLIPHSFIAKSQSKFLKDKKANLQKDEAIVLLDFSQNFSYVIQNEIQSNYWSRDYCSLHTVVIYTHGTTPDKPTITSLCVCSDDLHHDVAFVYETQKFITDTLKEKFPDVKDIMYFSDGCGGQYKNFKNFLNLSHHETDFQMKATWGFYATSHGKSACDGIGGTLKRMVTKASLQLSNGVLINSVEKFVEFCQRQVDNVQCFILKKEILEKSRKQLETRFAQGKTVPGTRSFHHFYPLSTNTIAAKRLSNDHKHSIIHSFSKQSSAGIQMVNIATNSYIACVYDDHWYFGLVLSKDEVEEDVEVTFMHPEGDVSTSSFNWPSKREDRCFVPLSNIISKVQPPKTTTSGRQYYFSDEDIIQVKQLYSSQYQ